MSSEASPQTAYRSRPGSAGSFVTCRRQDSPSYSATAPPLPTAAMRPSGARQIERSVVTGPAIWDRTQAVWPRSSSVP